MSNDKIFEIKNGVLVKYNGTDKNITIPEGVISIDDFAFDECEGLMTISLPASITMIDRCFVYCESDNLEAINVQAGNNFYSSIDGVLYDKKRTEVIAVPRAITSVTLPKSLTVIGNNAFNRCGSLKKVILPNGVTSIGQSAFDFCENLEEIKLPAGITSIGGEAFNFCSNLNITKLPESITYIGEGAFRCCKSLETIELPEGITAIENETFSGCHSLKTIKLPPNVNTIGKEAFSKCSRLETVTLPKSVFSISDDAFLECDSLKAINVDSDNISYSSIDGVLYNNMATKVIKVPCAIETVNLPESVTIIGDSAFESCANLETIMIPSGVTTIEDGGFKGCISLTSITLPESMTKIGREAFMHCTSLETINLPEGITFIGSSTFENCCSLETFTIPSGVTTIGSRAFAYCENLQSINLPEGITLIEDQVFSICKSLESVTFPEGVTSIGKSDIFGYNFVFCSCDSLKFIKLPDTLLELSDRIFDKNETVIINLSKYYPEQFDYKARKRCLSYNSQSLLENKDIEEDKLNAWINYFRGNGDRYYDEFIENEALRQFMIKYKCVVLEDVKELLNRTAEEGLTEVTAMLLEYEHNNFTEEEQAALKETELSPDYAYLNNFRIVQYEGEDFLTVVNYKGNETDIEIPQSINGVSVKRIGEYAFSTAQEALTDEEKEARQNITRLIIPECVTEIGEAAFDGCENLIDLQLPQAFLEKQGTNFEIKRNVLIKYNGKETDVAVPDNVKIIGNSAFFECESIVTISLPESVTEIGDDAFGCCPSLNAINVNVCNEAYSSVDGVLYNKDFTEVIKVPENIKSIKLPSSVTTIRDCAFEDCNKLQSVTIPSKVTSIGNSAFDGCEKLSSIKLPAALTTIGDNAFAGCEKLKSIKIQKGVTTIGNNVFEGCEKLSTISLPSGLTSLGDNVFSGCIKLKSIKLPAGISTIGNNLFYKCEKLSNIKMPESAVSIGEYAFFKCKSLKAIKIPSSVINIGEFAFFECESLKKIDLPKGIATIGDKAFEKCKNLKIQEPAGGNKR